MEQDLDFNFKIHVIAPPTYADTPPRYTVDDPLLSTCEQEPAICLSADFDTPTDVNAPPPYAVDDPSQTSFEQEPTITLSQSHTDFDTAQPSVDRERDQAASRVRAGSTINIIIMM